MAIRVLPEARDDLRDAASYYRALSPPKVGRELAARILQDFRHALAAVADMPLSRQEHPEIPGVRWVHFGTFPYFAFCHVLPSRSRLCGEVVGECGMLEADAASFLTVEDREARRSKGWMPIEVRTNP
jgi:plasmid stabilization system protein ParE